ncbi:hypothetical protein J5X84_16330 [Streptosporangiaceae bacterium NEAU-GS5]|nr:hypothetical protein [Streptosporangiaceae bacterium NEAU-GS5]
MTRYLCAAAYLSTSFRERVLAELLFDEFRAVVPSYGGFDLVPVVHHCRRSRTMLVVRDAAIALILALGLVTQPVQTLAWLSTLVPFVLLTMDPIRRGNPLVRILIWFWAGYSVISMIGIAFLTAGGSSPSGFLGGPDFGRRSAGDASSGSILGSLLNALAIPLITLGVAVGYRIAVYLTLAGSLRPGALEPSVRIANPKIARRLEYVREAQWGNVTMYANEDAFLGAGTVDRRWSIAVELDRMRGGARRDDPVDIDPVELHTYVRARLIEMRDRVLRPNESVQRLDIGDNVVTRGTFTVADWERGQTGGAHPMIDRNGLPRFSVTPQEVAAIIRHPQGGIRYYQRVTVSNAGQEIRDALGNLVAPAEDQEALTSAFIYLAVEGRMLYTQFVVMVLPPAEDAYHVVDLLPAMSGARVAVEAVRVLRLQLLRDVLAAPIRVLRTAAGVIRQNAVTPNPADHIVYPYGAGLSVRELGASDTLRTHIQALDAAKYIKLIEQRLTQAVLDFLDERRIDTGAYRLQAASVVMNTTISMGANSSINGPLSFGPNASATVNNAGQPTA